MIPKRADEEGSEDKEPEDMIEAIVKRFLTEQTATEETTLKIEIVDNHQSTHCEDERYQGT